MSPSLAALVLAWIAIGVLTLAMTGLIRQVRVLADGIATARPVSKPSLLNTAATDLASMLGPNGGLALFVTSDCRTCRLLLEQLDASRFGDRLVLVGASHPTAAYMIDDEADDLFERYGIDVTPFGLVIDSRKTISAAQPIASADDLIRLAQVDAGASTAHAIHGAGA